MCLRETKCGWREAILSSFSDREAMTLSEELKRRHSDSNEVQWREAVCLSAIRREKVLSVKKLKCRRGYQPSCSYENASLQPRKHLFYEIQCEKWLPAMAGGESCMKMALNEENRNWWLEAMTEEIHENMAAKKKNLARKLRNIWRNKHLWNEEVILFEAVEESLNETVWLCESSAQSGSLAMKKPVCQWEAYTYNVFWGENVKLCIFSITVFPVLSLSSSENRRERRKYKCKMREINHLLKPLKWKWYVERHYLLTEEAEREKGCRERGLYCYSIWHHYISACILWYIPDSEADLAEEKRSYPLNDFHESSVEKVRESRKKANGWK